MTRHPGTLAVSRIAALPSGGVAQCVVTEDGRRLYARLHEGGSWSQWHLVADGIKDVSVAADPAQDGAALISVVAWFPQEAGTIPAHYSPWREAFYRLTAAGATPADDL